MSENRNTIKGLLLEFMDFLRFKIEHDRLTIKDMQTMSRLIQNGLDIRGTAEDFAAFYGKSVDNVRHVLHRKVFDSPKREVLHPFSKFREAVPPSWLNDK